MATAQTGFPAFDNTYARLPERFYARQPSKPVAEPRLLAFNHALARELGFDPDSQSSLSWAGIFSGNEPLPGIEPLAMAYAGHQFGQFVPQLGDGRALLLGELIDHRGERRDVQLKGAGRTPFSRQGDGRSALGPVLREYVVSEAMHALGVPTTRALAAVTTGEDVVREAVLPGAILTRVAKSHVRVGTFQYFAAREDWEAVRQLADYVIERHYPEVRESSTPYLELLRRFALRQASLVAEWIGIGFIHGVMNTDNVSIAGETIDFGPCAFMDEYDPTRVFSSIDHMGRYAYGRQPQIAGWNIARFAEALLTLLDDDADRAVSAATEVLNDFSGHFDTKWLERMAGKLGISDPSSQDATLVTGLLELMQQADADFTLTFRRLADVVEAGFSPESLDPLLPQAPERDRWINDWRQRLSQEVPASAVVERMRLANPIYIPRNHLLEQMIRAAEDDGDFTRFEKIIEVVATPFQEQDVDPRYTLPPEPGERVLQTFCGT